MRGSTKSKSVSGVPPATLMGPVRINWGEEESRGNVEEGLFGINGSEKKDEKKEYHIS